MSSQLLGVATVSSQLLGVATVSSYAELSAPCMSHMCIVAVTDCQHKGECSGESVTGERDLQWLLPSCV